MTAGGGDGKPDALPEALIVAGPTCSGKSALALALAETLSGEIINADSMQIYRELRLVTARPSPEEEARVPHALYGVRAAADAGSAAWWRGEALAAIASARARGLLPILCGGTGMYLAALTQGLADIPDPGPAARAEARALVAAEGAPALHARLEAADPATAATLRPSDGQRLARAWEVWRGTGRGLTAWHAAAEAAPADLLIKAILLDPPRAALRAAIAGRFAAMVAAGALDEVAALLAQGLDPALPAMRAHGVPELSAYLRGEMTLEAAEARACLVTGQYTRRQATWFRHRDIVPPARRINLVARFTGFSQLSCSSMADMRNFIYAPVDAAVAVP